MYVVAKMGENIKEKKRSIISKRKITVKFRRVIKDLEPRVKLLVLPNRFFVEFFCRFCTRTYFPLKVFGKENIPQDNSFIIVSNHSSHIDTGILGVASDLAFNRIAMLAAKDYWFENKVRRFLIYFFFNLIPVERKLRRETNKRTTFGATVNFCKNFLQKGRSGIIMYPEGSRTKDGEIKNFKDGASKLAIELQIPILPVYLDGTYRALSRHDWIPKPTRIKAVIGKPVIPPALKKGESTNSKEKNLACRTVTEEIYDSIILLKKQYGRKH